MWRGRHRGHPRERRAFCPDRSAEDMTGVRLSQCDSGSRSRRRRRRTSSNNLSNDLAFFDPLYAYTDGTGSHSSLPRPGPAGARNHFHLRSPHGSGPRAPKLHSGRVAPVDTIPTGDIAGLLLFAPLRRRQKISRIWGSLKASYASAERRPSRPTRRVGSDGSGVPRPFPLPHIRDPRAGLSRRDI
jgi:hypothetical protein